MRTCLFVDDEPLILKAIGRLLRGEPFTPAFATSPVEALDLCRQRAFDIVVSDFRMPEMNGVELLRAVQSLYPSSKRVLLTGQADARVLVEAMRDGTIHLVISKPFERETLLRALREHGPFCPRLAGVSVER